MTLCGTRPYLAPEIYSELQRCVDNETRLGYTAVVDIWSLGVVACELAWGLPQYRGRYRNDGVAWCESIVTRLQEAMQESLNDLGQFLLNTMVVLSPELRCSANDCYDLVVRLPQTVKDSLHAGTPSPYPEEEDQTTLKSTVQNDDIEDPATAVYQPRSHTGTTTSFYRSGAPAPSSRMTKQHGEIEVSSSPAGRRYTHGQEGLEVADSSEDYSANPFDTLYVGASLAPQLRVNNSEDWSSQIPQESVQGGQAGAAGSQTSVHPRLARSSIPRGERGVWHPVSRTVEECNAIGVDDYEEMAQAAFLLQAIGQDSRAA